VLLFLQQSPIVVEVIRQPEAAPDISLQYVLGMFMVAGAAIAFAALGGLLAGGLFVLYRRYRESHTQPTNPADELRLRI
jgi:hypothetical protein